MTLHIIFSRTYQLPPNTKHYLWFCVSFQFIWIKKQNTNILSLFQLFWHIRTDKIISMKPLSQIKNDIIICWLINTKKGKNQYTSNENSTSIKNNQKSNKYYHFIYNPKIEDLFKSCSILKAISLHFKCKLISEYEIIIWYAR